MNIQTENTRIPRPVNPELYMQQEATRPSIYTPEEIVPALQELFSYDSLLEGMQAFLPPELCNYILQEKNKIHSVDDFQRQIILPILRAIEQSSTRQLDCSGLENLLPGERYLFISNHRDIVLDSAFMNRLLLENGFETAIMAVGDNLMRHRISELIFRLNKSFVVKRSGTAMELYQYSVALSAFIRDQVMQRISSVWIAQREGRAKDGNDRTQVGLLKMLSLASTDSLADFFDQLNIIPVSISYEIDPCAVLKTREYLQKRSDPHYKKSFREDVDYMLQGIKGQKGHIHIHFGEPLKGAALATMRGAPNAKKQLEALATSIDQSIHRHYLLHPVHYVAYDLLHGGHAMAAHYSASAREAYHQFFEEQASKIGADPDGEGKKYLLGIYANPVLNQLNNPL
jgi:hypothetical protein